jgi:hypothetical protein
MGQHLSAPTVLVLLRHALQSAPGSTQGLAAVAAPAAAAGGEAAATASSRNDVSALFPSLSFHEYVLSAAQGRLADALRALGGPGKQRKVARTQVRGRASLHD